MVITIMDKMQNEWDLMVLMELQNFINIKVMQWPINNLQEWFILPHNQRNRQISINVFKWFV